MLCLVSDYIINSFHLSYYRSLYVQTYTVDMQLSFLWQFIITHIHFVYLVKILLHLHTFGKSFTSETFEHHSAVHHQRLRMRVVKLYFLAHKLTSPKLLRILEVCTDGHWRMEVHVAYIIMHIARAYRRQLSGFCLYSRYYIFNTRNIMNIPIGFNHFWFIYFYMHLKAPLVFRH